MISPLYAVLLGAAGLVSGLPAVDKRTVTALNTAAFEQAQQRDNTATRAFSAVQIHTGTGQCLFVDELSGDFRANLTPIQVAACDSSPGQQWDVITSGIHDNVAGAMLVVSSLTEACMNFDPRRAAGDQVLLFACGGRADGTGQVTNSQLFPFSGGAGPLALTPENAPGQCFTVQGNVVGIAACNANDPNQQFTFGDGSVTVASTTSSASPSTTATAVESTPPVVACAASPVAASTSSSTSSAASAAATTGTAAVTTAAAAQGTLITDAANPTIPVSVSRAGGVLQPSAAAQSNPFDNTATFAFTGVQIKSANGLCLFIDPTAGDFRQNLIPITFEECDGSLNEQFDFITAGAHNNVANSTLIVSSLTNGCLNFDNRRAAGDTVILFSCGGRADGSGQVTNSQLFTFTAGETTLRLEPENGDGQVCLVEDASGRLDQAPCSTDPSQLFTIG